MIDTFSKLNAKEVETISLRNNIGITFTSNSRSYIKSKTELVDALNTIYQAKNATDKRSMLIDMLQEGRSLIKIFKATQVLYSSSLPQVTNYTKTTTGDITTYIPNNLSEILTSESYIVFKQTNLIYVVKKFLQSSKVVGISVKIANKINNHTGQTVSITYVPKSVVNNLFLSIKNPKLCTRFSVVCNSNLRFKIFYEYHKVDSSFITFNTKLNSSNNKIYKQVTGLSASDIDGVDSLTTSSTLFNSTTPDDAIDYTIVKLPEEIQRDIKLIKVNILIQNNTNIERYLIGFLGSEIQVHNLDFKFNDLAMLGKIISYVR
jgi:hypothetical protein